MLAFQTSFSNPLLASPTTKSKTTSNSFNWSSFTPVLKSHRVHLPSINQVKENLISFPTCSAKTSTWSSLSTVDFDTKLSTNELCLCFVGMSNCGKSHWSNELATQLKFHAICVDDLIEKNITPELQTLGFSGIDGMAEWMGFPTDDRFDNNQDRYLSYEEQITACAKPKIGKNTVLDTTGSVVYLTNETLDKLKKDYLIVHLEASDDMLEVMTDNYFETPKPVVWGDAFNRKNGETPEEALRRCYPVLLRERRKRYEQLAHVTVPAKVSLSRDVTLDQVLDYIRGKLN